MNNQFSGMPTGNKESLITKKEYPTTFPMPMVAPELGTEERKAWDAERQARKVGLTKYDELTYYFNDGSLYEGVLNNFWYTTKGKKHLQPYLGKPQDIEVTSFGEVLNLPYTDYFIQSAAMQELMNRPDGDEKRQKVIEYLTTIIVHSMSGEMQEKIAKIPDLQEKISQYVKNEIERAGYFLRENQKWNKNELEFKDRMETPEYKKFSEIQMENDELGASISSIIQANTL